MIRMKTILWQLVRGGRAPVSFAAFTLIVTAVTLALAPPAHAQGSVDALAVTAGYAEPIAAADPPADAPIDGIAPIAAATGGEFGKS